MKNKPRAIPARRVIQRTVNHHVGNQIKRVRRHYGKPLDVFGHVLGVSAQQIARLEHGKNRISAAQLYLIARSTNTPIQWFFAGMQRRELQRHVPVVVATDKVSEPRVASDLYQESVRMEDLAWSFRSIKSAVVKNLFTELAHQIACEYDRG